MRRRIATLLAMAAGVAACSGSGGRDAKSGVRLPTGSPDPIVLRIPLSGGPVRAYRYPALDSLAWRSSGSAPEFGSVLAFDAEDGVIAFADSQGVPGWIDLRLGDVRRAGQKSLGLASSAEGSSIFGVTESEKLVRLTGSGDWTDAVDKGTRIKRLFPQPDGSLVVLTELGGSRKKARLARFNPPNEGSTDSIGIDLPQRGTGTALGDRVYLAIGRDLVGVPISNFAAPTRVKASDEILAIAPTPSGDRVYLATKGEKSLDVVDRYAGNISDHVRVRGFVTELRMDPLGRYLLVRPVAGDSAWVVAIATNELIGTVRTTWREDLPMVAPDGAIGTLRGADVDFVDPVSRKVIVRAEGGASDYWYAVLWNGLRPRAKGLDRAVTFQTEESPQTMDAAHPDSGARAPDSAVTVPAPRPPVDVPQRPAEPAREPPRERGGWTVSFAAVLSEDRARELSQQIRVDGANARVSVSRSDATPVYRVLMGPYPTRADADRVGKASGHSYWIIEGIP
ncbi:MAG: SPOR domain-containing protein [Gemmatimonadaceae bacterium]